MSVAAVFCFGQILLYLWVFCKSLKMRLVGLAVPVIAVVVLCFTFPQVRTVAAMTLEDVHLSPTATAALEAPSLGTVTFTAYDPARISISSGRYGTTTLTITDGTQQYFYTVRVVRENHTDLVFVEPKEESSPKDTSSA